MHINYRRGETRTKVWRKAHSWRYYSQSFALSRAKDVNYWPLSWEMTGASCSKMKKAVKRQTSKKFRQLDKQIILNAQFGD